LPGRVHCANHQGVLDLGAEVGGLDGLPGSPAEELGEEDEPCYGVELLGGCAEGVTEVAAEFVDGHDLEEDRE
jgi:hypothetical protein